MAFIIGSIISRAEIWLIACGREDLRKKIDNLGSYRICAAHFEDKMYLNDLKNRLMPNAVPTIFFSMESSSQTTHLNDHNYSCASVNYDYKRNMVPAPSEGNVLLEPYVAPPPKIRILENIQQNLLICLTNFLIFVIHPTHQIPKSLIGHLKGKSIKLIC